MDIPPDQLESTKTVLRHLIDERTSTPWATSDEEDMSMDEQDYEDIEKIKTVLDVLHFLVNQGDRTCLVEYSSCLDPLDKFEGTFGDDRDESNFRGYLTSTYGIDPKEFPDFS